MHARDWLEAFRRHPLWCALALEDLRDRYRRTSLGLAWVVLSFGAFVIVKVTIFGQLSTASPAEFAMFVIIGFGLWTHISSLVLDSCTAYIHARPWILAASVPYPVFLLQAVYRNWLVFALISVVMVGSLFWKATPWTPTMLWALPAIVVYAINSVWIAAVLAPACARFRDAHHLVQTVMRLLFFATPILWMPPPGSFLDRIAQWNPISHFIAIVREPLIHDTVPVLSWTVVLAITAIGVPAGVLSYARTRDKIVFWV
ncbi:MAG TPA: ABC transporter permease [Luteimonas sp.]|nr:ABC transporter permease [Luteimonas sp.]